MNTVIEVESMSWQRFSGIYDSIQTKLGVHGTYHLRLKLYIKAFEKALESVTGLSVVSNYTGVVFNDL